MNIENKIIETDVLAEVTQKEMKKSLQFLGSIRPKRGHTLFEVNLSTGEIVPATFEEQIYDFTVHGQKRKNKAKKSVIKKDRCIYIPALNIKNVVKVLKRFNNQN